MEEIEAGDPVTLAGSEAMAVVISTPAEDHPGAGWTPYRSEQFMPTVAREGRRQRSDTWDWRRWRDGRTSAA